MANTADIRYIPGEDYNSVKDTTAWAKENNVPIMIKYGRDLSQCESCKSFEFRYFQNETYDWLKKTTGSMKPAAYIHANYDLPTIGAGTDPIYVWARLYFYGGFGTGIYLDPYSGIVLGAIMNDPNFDYKPAKKNAQHIISYLRRSPQAKTSNREDKGGNKRYDTCPQTISITEEPKKYGVFGNMNVRAVLCRYTSAHMRDSNVLKYWYKVAEDKTHGVPKSNIAGKQCKFSFDVANGSTRKGVTVSFYDSLDSAERDASFASFNLSDYEHEPVVITPPADTLFIRVSITSKYTANKDFEWYLTTYVENPDIRYVQFNDYDGTVLKERQAVATGGDAVPPPDPYRKGRRFSGWDPDYVNVQSDLTCVAQYMQYANPRTVSAVNKDTTLFAYV